jgi:hypothetical protein
MEFKKIPGIWDECKTNALLLIMFSLLNMEFKKCLVFGMNVTLTPRRLQASGGRLLYTEAFF